MYLGSKELEHPKKDWTQEAIVSKGGDTFEGRSDL